MTTYISSNRGYTGLTVNGIQDLCIHECPHRTTRVISTFKVQSQSISHDGQRGLDALQGQCSTLGVVGVLVMRLN